MAVRIDNDDGRTNNKQIYIIADYLQFMPTLPRNLSLVQFQAFKIKILLEFAISNLNLGCWAAYVPAKLDSTKNSLLELSYNAHQTFSTIQSRKDFKSMPGFYPITFPSSENSYYRQESLLLANIWVFIEGGGVKSRLSS